ncbi:MAG: flagellar basal body protein [Azospirillaceae bacterium]
MTLDNLALFRMVAQRFGWLEQRQGVTAQNIANADTPGYSARDIEAFDAVLSRAGGARMAPRMTHAAHMTAPETTPGDARTGRADRVYEVSPTGNSVVLEQQLMTMQETAAQHRFAQNLYTKHLGMIRMAIGSGQR